MLILIEALCNQSRSFLFSKKESRSLVEGSTVFLMVGVKWSHPHEANLVAMCRELMLESNHYADMHYVPPSYYSSIYKVHVCSGL